METFKRARRRELEHQGKPVPSVLLPTEPSELLRRHNNLDDQRLPFDTEASE